MTFADFFFFVAFRGRRTMGTTLFACCLLLLPAAAAALQNGTLAILGRAHTLSHSGLEQKNTQSLRKDGRGHDGHTTELHTDLARVYFLLNKN